MKIKPTGTKPHLHFLPILLAFVIIQITGCTTLRIATNASPANTPSTSKRINRIFWGIGNKKERIADPIYPKNGIQSVNFSITKSDGLVSILTVGIYCPVHYSYVVALAPRYNAKHSVAKNNSPGRRECYDSTASGWHETKLYSTYFTHDTVLHRPVVVKRLLWGLINSLNQNDVIPNSSENGGVQSIHIHVKFWEGVVTFFTAGIYCPVTYTYTFSYLGDEY